MPEELVRRAKAHAALRGISLKLFVIQAMETAVSTLPDPAPASRSPAIEIETDETDFDRGFKKQKKDKKKNKKHKKDKKQK